MTRSYLLSAILVLIAASTGWCQTLNLPARPGDALSGDDFAILITPMERIEREQEILHQIEIGNVPDFFRTLSPITVTESIGGQDRTALYYVTPEYACIGSNIDYFLMPMTPTLAQQVADLLGCNLPTRKMVDDIYSSAAVKLAPSPIPPSPEMTTVPVFAEHNATVRQQRSVYLSSDPLGALVGGHKKDVVVTPQLATNPGKVAIYGWHRSSDDPIQPLYLGHVDWYADYSHGIRLAQMEMTVDGQPTTVPQVLADPVLHPLLSDEGSFSPARYPLPSPPGNFPYRDLFPATGRQLSDWIDRFTTPEIRSFTPAAPGGDGSILVVRDPSGGIDTTRLGAATDTDYFVQCALYCNYRPQLASDGFERVGIFARDDGSGLFEGISGGGVQGNNYALTWDSHDGSVHCLRTVNGVPTDLRPAVPMASSGWRLLRIEAVADRITFRIDGAIIHSVTDATHPDGQFGIGYHEYFATNTNILGTYADNFLANRPGEGENSNWHMY